MMARRSIEMCLRVVGAAGLALGLVGQAGAQATLTIDAGKPIAKVSPTLYGLMTEEINYSYDGGLYGELVQNRTFLQPWGDTENWVYTPMGDARGKAVLDKTTGPSAALTTSMKVTVAKADTTNPLGLRNGGWWGITVRPHTAYQGSVWAKADAAGPAMRFSLVANDSGKVVASTDVPALSTAWKQYTFTLTSGDVVAGAGNTLMVQFTRPGTVWMQLPSLFPPTYHDRANGNRPDLMEKMAAMSPTFLRLPGGNYLEGDHVKERFDWKKTLGPLVDRPTHRGPWNYQSSDGMGLLEYLEWCEDLKIQPVLAVYAGYSLKQDVVLPGAALEPFVQEALEEIEYVTGDASTKWGAERVKGGHPLPFPLTYVEIGNEDNFDHSKSYEGRYAQFYDAIKKKYPALQLIATMPVKGRTDLVDDHFYRRAEEFFVDTHHYDRTDRNGPKIFVGEWATREGTPTPNMGAALGDAAWMTGMERNSDLVVLASYAPLFVNVNPGGMQWASDLIGYDAYSSFGSPSYYAQVMFAGHVGTEVVASELKGAGDHVFYSVTKDAAKGVLYLKLVNASSAATSVKLHLDGAKEITTLRAMMMSAATTAATNTITAPRNVVPGEAVDQIDQFRAGRGSGVDGAQALPAYSIQVLELGYK